MKIMLKLAFACAAILLAAAVGSTVSAKERDDHHDARPAVHAPPEHHGEPHSGPSGYRRPVAPQGWDARPKQVDRAAYQHNYQAARSYKIGPYHRPTGWGGRRWSHGDHLPRAYWTQQYLIADYWLFGLEVPPMGYEWVRVGDDALLIEIGSGIVLQAEYGVFA